MFLTVAITVAILAGQPTVKDGDGLLFGKVEIRLQGVAAPEANNRQRDPGGPEATANLKKLVDGKPVTCHLDGTVASSNRPVAICYVDDQDLGWLQVQQGFARDCPAFSKGRYAEAEAVAQADGKHLKEIYMLPNYCD